MLARQVTGGEPEINRWNRIPVCFSAENRSSSEVDTRVGWWWTSGRKGDISDDA